MAEEQQPKKQVTTLTVGLDQDSSFLNYPTDSYKYALNSQIEANKGISGWLGTEESNIKCGDWSQTQFTFCMDGDCDPGSNITVYLSSYQIMGSKTLPDESIILFLAGGTLGFESMICQIDKYCNVKLIIAATCLNFSTQHPICDVEYRELADCTKPIYFTDNFNPVRKLDIAATYNIFDPITGFYALYTGDCDEFKLFKNFNTPCLQVTDVNDTGGNLASGAYYFGIEYSTISGFGLFPPQSITNPIPIIHDQWKGAIDNSTHIDINSNAQGCDANTPTSKSIDLAISNLNTTDFQYFNLIVVKQIGGIKTAFTVITLPITQTTYTYTGFEHEISRSIDSVVAEGVVYDTGKTLCSANQRLNIANLTANNNPNFQQWANQIGIKWVAKEHYASNPSEDHFSPLKAANEKTFMWDEVYAISIRLLRNNGTKTCAYHIPGRQKNLDHSGVNIQSTCTESTTGGTHGFENDQYDNLLTDNGAGFVYWDSSTQLNGLNLEANDCSTNNELKCEQESSIERWMVYNTATMDENSWNPNSGYDSTCLSTGEMAYWESCLDYPDLKDCDGNSLYPEGKIRHHKFPDSSILHIHDGYGDARNLYERPNLRTLGINAYNVNIPNTDEYADIVGWEILIADRTGNESILAKGIMFNNWLMTDDDGSCFYPAPVYNDTRNYDAGCGAGNGLYYENPGGGTICASTCGNRPADESNGVFYGSNVSSLPTADRKPTAYSFNFWSPETSYMKPALSVSKLTTYTEEYGAAYFTANEGINYNIVASIGTYNCFNRLTAYYDLNRKLNTTVYINRDAFEGTLGGSFRIKNFARESWVELEITNINSNLPSCDYITPITNPCDKSQSCLLLNPADYPNNTDVETITGYYAAIKSENLDLYSTLESIQYLENGKCYFDKNLTTTDASINSGGTVCDTALFEGDCFIAPHIFHKRHCWESYKTFASGGCDNGCDTCHVELYYGVPQYWVETKINTYYRTDHINFTAQYSIPYLNNGTYTWIDWLDNQVGVTEDNYYYYNIDYSALNNIKSPKTCTNQDLTTCCSNTYKTRDIFSEVGNNEQGFDAWTQFAPTSYYDYDKTDIEVVDIFSKYDSLYIRTPINLWRHPLNPQEIETSTSVAILNPSAYLSTIPVKLGDTEVGYGGSENQICINNTPFGVFYGSTTDRRIYQFTEKLNDISSIRMKSFFKENLQLYLRDAVDAVYGVGTYTLFDSPTDYNGTGLISGWDNKYNRWIFTKIDYKPLYPITVQCLPPCECAQCVDPSLVNYIRYEASTGTFWTMCSQCEDIEQVFLQDENYFENKSFTISYSPINQRWISFHSYIPTWYITAKNSWYSFMSEVQSRIYGDNYECFGREFPNQLWIHNKGEGDSSTSVQYSTYRSFYGCVFPYIIELVKSYGYNTAIEPNLNWVQETYQQSINQQNPPLPRDLEASTFNKCYVYNNYQHSGNLDLTLLANPTWDTGDANFQSENDLSTIVRFPNNTGTSIEAYVNYWEGNFHLSGFENRRKFSNFALLNTNLWYPNNTLNTDFIAAFPIDQVVNNQFIDYTKQPYDVDNFRDNYCIFRMILDNNNHIKICNNFFITEPQGSIN